MPSNVLSHDGLLSTDFKLLELPQFHLTARHDLLEFHRPDLRFMTARILLIDNYDSFVFNLARYLKELGTEASVVRNDAIPVDEVENDPPDAIVISPGPGTPHDAGISVEAVIRLGACVPILGVCLGHQSIVTAYGGQVVRDGDPVHGRTSLVHHDGTGLFATCPCPLRVTRYHSLIADKSSLPDCLNVTAETDDGIIMAIQHQNLPVLGVQFHPESILTQCGHLILSNFLSLAGINHHMSCGGAELPPNKVSDDFYRRTIDPDAGPRT